MKKLFIALSIISTLATVMLFAYGRAAQAASQPESGDLCGGTGGNGQVVSVGSGDFIMKRNDDSGDQIVRLSERTIINTISGAVPLSELKEGMRVTLVGGPNRDGSFTADYVFVCATGQGAVTQETGTQENEIGQTASPTERKENIGNKMVSGIINIATITFFVLVWLGMVAYLKLKKGRSLAYLFFFTIFCIYLYKVLDYVLLQFQSLLLMRHFLPGLMLNGVPAGTSVNLIPLATLTLRDVKTSLLNILMMMPFGFGLPFITDFRFKKVVVTGLLLSIAIELLQLVTGFAANTTFRIADVNDLIFNTLGAAAGYILFILFMRLYRRLLRGWKAPKNIVLRYIAERPQVDKR